MMPPSITSPGSLTSLSPSNCVCGLTPPFVYLNLTSCDLGWVGEQGCQMLLYELSSPKGRLLLSILMLKDARRNYYPVAGVDPVVSEETRHFADDGHEAFLGHLPHLLRVGHAVLAPHRNVHSF